MGVRVKMVYREKLLPLRGKIDSIVKAGYKIRRPGYKLKSVHGIIVHSTANLKSSANNEADWLVNKNNDRAASYHMVVDEKECITVIPLDEVSYGTTSSSANYNYVQLEICESGDRQRTLSNALNVIADFLDRNNLSVQSVKRHSEFQTKDCPRILPPVAWRMFLEDIQAELNKRNKLKQALELRKENIQKAVEFVIPFTSDDKLWEDVFNGYRTPSSSQLHSLLNKLLQEQAYTDPSKTVSRLYERKCIKSITYWDNVLKNRTILVPEYLVTLVLNIKHFIGVSK